MADVVVKFGWLRRSIQEDLLRVLISLVFSAWLVSSSTGICMISWSRIGFVVLRGVVDLALWLFGFGSVC